MANDLARKVIETAYHELEAKVQEQPRGSNAGPKVDVYLKTVGLGPGFAWCSAFACWCVLTAALQLQVHPQLSFSASALYLWSQNEALQFHDLDAGEDIPCIGIYDHGMGRDTSSWSAATTRTTRRSPRSRATPTPRADERATWSQPGHAPSPTRSSSASWPSHEAHRPHQPPDR